MSDNVGLPADEQKSTGNTSVRIVRIVAPANMKIEPVAAKPDEQQRAVESEGVSPAMDAPVETPAATVAAPEPVARAVAASPIFSRAMINQGGTAESNPEALPWVAPQAPEPEPEHVPAPVQAVPVAAIPVQPRPEPAPDHSLETAQGAAVASQKSSALPKMIGLAAGLCAVIGIMLAIEATRGSDTETIAVIGADPSDASANVEPIIAELTQPTEPVMTFAPERSLVPARRIVRVEAAPDPVPEIAVVTEETDVPVAPAMSSEQIALAVAEAFEPEVAETKPAVADAANIPDELIDEAIASAPLVINTAKPAKPGEPASVLPKIVAAIATPKPAPTPSPAPVVEDVVPLKASEPDATQDDFVAQITSGTLAALRAKPRKAEPDEATKTLYSRVRGALDNGMNRNEIDAMLNAGMMAHRIKVPAVYLASNGRVDTDAILAAVQDQ